MKDTLIARLAKIQQELKAPKTNSTSLATTSTEVVKIYLKP